MSERERRTLRRRHPEVISWAEFFFAQRKRRTGGMIALLPRSDCAEMLVVSGGEPEEELHCTLVYLGEDVTGMDSAGLGDALSQISGSCPSITARVFGHAIFNPDDSAEEGPGGCIPTG